MSFFSMLPEVCRAQEIRPEGGILEEDVPTLRVGHVEVSIVLDQEHLQLHDDLNSSVGRIGIYFKIDDNWHIYWKDPGEAGIPTQITWKTPPGWSVGDLQWPQPTRHIERGNIITNAYSEETLLFSRIMPPPYVPDRDEYVVFEAEVSWLVCEDRCIPGSATLRRTVLTTSVLQEESSDAAPLFVRYSELVPPSDEDAYRVLETAKPHVAGQEDAHPRTPSSTSSEGSMGILLALAFAFIGGIILNFMPCVLPIVGIKVMGVVSAKDKSRAQNAREALAYTLGIMGTLSILGALAVVLKNSGHALGWGFQFQDPSFLVALIVIVFILSFGFFDVYVTAFPALRFNPDGRWSKGSTFAKHVFDGAMVAILSTPCTAPFLGTALVFAFTQSALTLFLVFFSIGLGLALPYFLLVTSPSLLRLFPRPGEWMNSLKEFLGLLLLVTIVWLIYVLSTTFPSSPPRVLLLLLAIYSFFWLLKVRGNYKSPIARSFFLLVGLALPTASLYFMHPLRTSMEAHENLMWEPYEASKVEEATVPVFIDFTAEWCITCKYNENFVLSKPKVAEAFKEKTVLLLKADWTSGDETITRALEEYGGNGVPHYVLIDTTKKTHILSNLLTESEVLGALDHLE